MQAPLESTLAKVCQNKRLYLSLESTLMKKQGGGGVAVIVVNQSPETSRTASSSALCLHASVARIGSFVHFHFHFSIFPFFLHSALRLRASARITGLPSSVHSSKFRIPQVFCLPFLRKHPGWGGILPILETDSVPVLPRSPNFQCFDVQTFRRSDVQRSLRPLPSVVRFLRRTQSAPALSDRRSL
jgi:hypothetical protein